MTIEELAVQASRKGVGITIDYCEASNHWEGTINSAAPAEQREYKKRVSFNNLSKEMLQDLQLTPQEEIVLQTRHVKPILHYPASDIDLMKQLKRWMNSPDFGAEKIKTFGPRTQEIYQILTGEL